MRLTIVKLAISVGLVWFVVSRFSFAELKAQILKTDPVALIVPFVVILISNVLGAVQWAWILRSSGVLLAWARVIVVYFIGLFFNNFSFGNLGGDVYKIYVLGRPDRATTAVAGATVVDRLVGAAALCALGLVAALGAFVQRSAPWPIAALNIAACFGVMSVAGLILHERLGSRLGNFFRALPWKAVSTRIGKLLDNVHEYRLRSNLLNGAFVLSLLIQACRVMAHFFVGLAMGWSLGAGDAAKFFLVIPLVGLLIALPISIGGWGVREAAGMALWAPLGRDGEEAVTMLALTASLTFIVSMLGGVALVATSLRSARRSAV